MPAGGFTQAHIHGPTLAFLLACPAVDCDGLLFGQIKDVEHRALRDSDSGATATRERHVYITAHHVNATTQSFYDAAGDVQGEALAAMLPRAHDPIVGWLSVRRGAHGAPLAPSMRDAAVTASLAQQAARQGGFVLRDVPVLYMVLSSAAGHHGATLTLQYKLYQAIPQPDQPHAAALQPLELQITNLARTLSHKAHAFDPAMGMAAPSTLQQPGAAAALAGLVASVESSAQAVAGMEEYHESLLRQLQLLTRQASSRSAALHALHQEGEELARALEEEEL